MDTNRHKFFMLQLLKDIFSDALLSSVMAFKGGTATMFFYNLPRFSTDLDKCLESVRSVSEKSLISGLGELTEGEMKNFVRNGLKDELISLLTMFKAFPSFV